MKRYILIFTTFLLIFIGSFSACRKDIDSKINIRIEKMIEDTLLFYCHTEEIYPCSNYSIKYEYKQTSNNIYIIFKEIIKWDACATAFGPARACINLGVLENGTYNLYIQNGNIKHKGELTVSSDSYKINFRNNNKIKFINKYLNKNN